MGRIYRFELNENQSRIDLLEIGFELRSVYIFGAYKRKVSDTESTKKEEQCGVASLKIDQQW